MQCHIGATDKATWLTEAVELSADAHPPIPRPSSLYSAQSTAHLTNPPINSSIHSPISCYCQCRPATRPRSPQSTPLYFIYLVTPILTSIFPPSLPLTGDQLITLTSSSFTPSSSLTCGFTLASPAFSSPHSLCSLQLPPSSVSSLPSPSPLPPPSSSPSLSSAQVVHCHRLHRIPRSHTSRSLVLLFPHHHPYTLTLASHTPLPTLPTSPSLLLRCIFTLPSTTLSTFATANSTTASITVTDGVVQSAALLQVTWYAPPVLMTLSLTVVTWGDGLTIVGEAWTLCPTLL